MDVFSLSLFVYLVGVGAASGLVYSDKSLKVISDDSDVLYTYNMDGNNIDKLSLHPSGELLEKRAKPEKSDFEAITSYQDTYYIFGSGSDKNRNSLIKVAGESNEVTQESLIPLYQDLRRAAEISEEDFNIEGAIIHKGDLLLFNRGNGPNQKNGVFFIADFLNSTSSYNISYQQIDLPGIHGVPFGFTDAILEEDKIYFLAAAEAGQSTYQDGQVLGSLIGKIDLKTMQLESSMQITNRYKFEGITVFEKTEENTTFLLCEDLDDGGQETKIFKLVLPRF